MMNYEFFTTFAQFFKLITMYKPLFNQRKALRFRQFSRKGYALFACLGRVVTIGVLSVATLRAAAVTSDSLSVSGASSAYMSADDTPDKEATLDEVEIMGSRAPLALGQAVRMVTVLTRDDIQAASVQSINDLLKLTASVDVRQRGPLGTQTDVSIRGGTQEQIAILLNDINICDPQTGHNTLDLPCDVSDIVRIEVLEGPAGRVYGTSSLVGAINIVTQERKGKMDDGRGMKAEVRMEGGSFGYLSAAGRAAISAPSPLTSAISASYTRSDGYQRSKSGALNSDYQGGKVFYQGSLSLDSDPSSLASVLYWHAGLSVKGFGSNTFYSAKYDEQFERTMKWNTAVQGDIICRRYEIRGKACEWHFKPAVYWNRSYDRFELIRGLEDKVPFNHHRTDVLGVHLNSYFDWLLGRTALGAEFRNEDIVSGNLGEPLHQPHDNYRYGLNRSNLSFHVEHNILWRYFTLSAGFIAVKNTWNEMPLTVYPGVDASIRVGEHWKLYASYNSSLRMPTFTELYYSVGGHKADKYLKAEELHAVEGGVKFGNNILTSQASIFHHHARNLIDWVMDTRETDPVWRSVNLTKVNTLGQEVKVNFQPSTFNSQFPTFHFQLSYCHLHQSKREQEYIQSQYSLEYLRHKLTANVLLQLTEHLELTLAYRWQDRMGSYTSTSGVVEQYHPYSVLDARVAWNTDTYSIYIKGNNLTNHHYVDFGNVPQPGCWLMLGTKIHLSRLFHQ